MTMLLNHPLRSQLLIQVLGRLLDGVNRVTVVVNFPELPEIYHDMEELVSQALIRNHPMVPNTFYVVWTPLNSTPMETQSLLNYQQQGLIFIDYESYGNLLSSSSMVSQVIQGTRLHLYKDGKFTVLVSRAGL